MCFLAGWAASGYVHAHIFVQLEKAAVREPVLQVPLVSQQHVVAAAASQRENEVKMLGTNRGLY